VKRILIIYKQLSSGLENIVIFSKISDIFDIYISRICTYIAKII